jgi:hypothetical protein
MAEIEATKATYDPNEGGPDAKISSNFEENFDEKKPNVPLEDQLEFDETYDPDV